MATSMSATPFCKNGVHAAAVERVFVASGDCPRQRLHSTFEDAPWKEKIDERPGDMEVESEADRLLCIGQRKV